MEVVRQLTGSSQSFADRRERNNVSDAGNGLHFGDSYFIHAFPPFSLAPKLLLRARERHRRVTTLVDVIARLIILSVQLRRSALAQFIRHSIVHPDSEL